VKVIKLDCSASVLPTNQDTTERNTESVREVLGEVLCVGQTNKLKPVGARVNGVDFKSTTRAVATRSRLDRHHRGWNCSPITDWEALLDKDVRGLSQMEALSVRQPTGFRFAVGRVGGALPRTCVASRLERHQRGWDGSASTNWEALLDRDVFRLSQVEVDQW
jgi:hypothetical protein